MKIRRIPTGIFVTEQEAKDAITSFGEYHDDPTEEKKQKHNKMLQELAKKYDYEWTENEIAPNGEIIHVAKEEDK